MYAQVEKSKKNKSSSIANSVAQKKSNRKQGFGFVDNRPEAVAQRKLQEMVNKNSQATRMVQRYEKVDNNSAQYQKAIKKAENNTGLSDNSKTSIDNTRRHISAGTKYIRTLVHQPSANVIQAFGWQSLGRLNPREYIPTLIGGYTEKDYENQRKMAVANDAHAYAKSKITHGPQNQIWARDKYGDEGDVNRSAMIGLVDTEWQSSGGYNSNWTRPRRIGAAVEATGGGNCQDIAALTYNYLREHCEPSWTICFVVNYDIKHSFATIGKPGGEDEQDIVVADAWVQYPAAVTLDKHFCGKGAKLTVLRAKQGQKPNRTRDLMSKYWDTAALPGYVNGLKNTIWPNPRSLATWNNNYPTGR